MAGDCSMSIEHLVARAEIEDLLNRYAQAIDRKDWALARAAYHDDADADYGAYRGDVDSLFKYIQGRHEAIEQSLHFMGRTLIDIEGDDAVAVSPNIVFQRRKSGDSGPVAMFGDARPEGDKRSTIEIASRYLDWLQRRSGVWKIRRRVITHEWMRATIRNETMLMQSDWQIAARDHTDPLFAFKAKIPAFSKG
jgi:hypothetical protein